MNRSVTERFGITICLFWITLTGSVAAQEITCQCDPAHTQVRFTLGDVLHTVHGSFQSKQCEIRLDPASGTLSGQIIVDATSGETGKSARDRKMHKDVLESAHYPEIVFRPDRAQGKLTVPGDSNVQVHGTFGIHGSEHEITVPVAVKLAADHWQASAHFEIPYVAWGLKNPSVLLLRVGNTVDIDLHAEGRALPTVTSQGAAEKLR